MGSREIFFLLCFLKVVTTFLLFGSTGDGREFSRVEESEEEDMEFERQLKVLNKPARQSFQDLDGSIYDCVDIDKKPALENPLLKNHKVQTEPPPLPKEVNGDQATRSFAEPIEIGIKGAQCPLGTVIIRRTRKEDLIWARQHSKAYYPDTTANPNGFHFAVVAATNGSFHGAAGEINIYKATVKPTQFSEAVIWDQHKSPQTGMNSIQSGWAVNPMLFKDDQSRLVSLWTVSIYKHLSH